MSETRDEGRTEKCQQCGGYGFFPFPSDHICPECEGKGRTSGGRMERYIGVDEAKDGEEELIERLRESVRICQTADTLGASVLSPMAREIEEAIARLRRTPETEREPGEIEAYTYNCQDWGDRDKVPSTIEITVGHYHTGMVPVYVRVRPRALATKDESP